MYTDLHVKYEKFAEQEEAMEECKPDVFESIWGEDSEEGAYEEGAYIEEIFANMKIATYRCYIGELHSFMSKFMQSDDDYGIYALYEKTYMTFSFKKAQARKLFLSIVKFDKYPSGDWKLHSLYSGDDVDWNPANDRVPENAEEDLCQGYTIMGRDKKNANEGLPFRVHIPYGDIMFVARFLELYVKISEGVLELKMKEEFENLKTKYGDKDDLEGDCEMTCENYYIFKRKEHEEDVKNAFDDRLLQEDQNDCDDDN